MAYDHCYGRQGNRARISGEMSRGPNREGAFAEIPQQGQQEAKLARDSPGIFSANISAAQLAQILSAPHADNVITGGETTQCVSAQGNPARFCPVSRLK